MDVGVIRDWLGREGGQVLTWWLLATLAGAAVWPLLYRLLGGLPDRGYTLARAAGLMLGGFIFWFLGSLGLLRNTTGGMVFAWLVMAALALTAYLRWPDRPSPRAWLREHRALLLVTEAVFLLALFAWATYRAHNPEMGSTEKPMEMAFLNGIRRSETFPPNDPWLAGYAISYYYFGYVIMAMLADLGGTSSGIAFNLMGALLFALGAIGALGVVYNLVRAPRRDGSPGGSRWGALGAGTLGAVFLVLMGSLGTALVELPYRGYTPGLVNAAYFDFWDVEGRAGTIETPQAEGPPVVMLADSDGDTIPDWDDERLPFDRWTFWHGVGWRYSRVVHDRDLSGAPIGIQPITEFPNFSFVLSDNHPHVLALPFALLAVGLALNLALAGRELQRWEYPLYAIWVGGMVFMNSWDVIYLPLLVGADVLRRLIRRGTGTLSGADLWGAARFALVLGGLTLVLYLPWLISFTSQAGGFLPNVIYPTPWQQFFLHFGAFLIILTLYLIVEIRRAGRRFHWQAGLLGFTMAACSAALLLGIMGRIAWGSDEVRGAVYSVVSDVGGLRNLMPDILERRGIGLPSELLLLAFVFVVIGRLFARPARDDLPDPMGTPAHLPYNPATAFTLLLIGAGALLTFAPDFVYLRDNFSVRINTVFKLYYQGWILFSLASAFAVWSVLAGPGTAPQTQRDNALALAGQIAFGAVVILLLIAGLLYPALTIQGRALVETGRLNLKAEIDRCVNGLTPQGYPCPKLEPLTLDGAATLVSASPDEYAAIMCLDALETGDDAVIAEAPFPGGYAQTGGRTDGRVSALTGIPTLMGWQNHEGQWRGDTYPDVTDARYENGQYRDRIIDVHELYTTSDWTRAWTVIDRYGIDYIVVGSAERNLIRDLAGGDESRLAQYQLGLQKFAQVLTPVCQNGDMAIYRVAPN